MPESVYFLTSAAFYGCCMFGIVNGASRSQMREKYNIEGSFMSDCCLYCVCYPLALTQEKLEIDMHEIKDY